MSNNEINYADGTRLTIGGNWWRFDKSTPGASAFCRCDGREIVAGWIVGNEDIPMIAASCVHITPEVAREVGRGFCRTLHSAMLESARGVAKELCRTLHSAMLESARGVAKELCRALHNATQEGV